MAQNVIQNRVKSFLELYPPFMDLEDAVLTHLAGEIEILFYKKGQTIFEKDETPHPAFYITRKGSIKIEADGELYDQCDEGDIFGIRSLIVNKPYIASAICDEDSVVYSLSNNLFQQVAAEHPSLLMYFTAGFAAGRTIFRNEREGQTPLNDLALKSYGQAGFTGMNRLPVKTRKVVASEEMTIKEGAKLMSQEEVGSLVITSDQGLPLGIITDKDLRSKVATGKIAIYEALSEIMSSPVTCIKPEPTVNEVTMLFVKSNFHHLCITEDGTPNTPLVSVISDQDVLIEQSNNPAYLLKKAKKAKDLTGLRYVRDRLEELIEDYLLKDVSIDFVAEITAEIEDKIVERIFTLSLREMESPPCSFCWLALGSQGRREQLLRTDQDNALLYEVDDPKFKSFFLKLAQKVTDGLIFIGFEKCPADIMGNNPKWCMSLKEWKASFSSWIKGGTSEDILHSTIFFDFSPVYGNADLADQLANDVVTQAQDHSLFMSKLALNALGSPPPLSFFRNLVLEKSGEHKDEFDIKARAMVPLADAARLLCIYHKITQVNNTYERFIALSHYEVDKEVFEDAALAYKFLMKTRTLKGIQSKTNGRYINPANLNKLRRQVLKNIFGTISDLQTLIKVRFRTSMLT